MADRCVGDVAERLAPLDVESLTSGQIAGVTSPALKRVLSGLVGDRAVVGPRRHSEHLAATPPRKVLDSAS